MLLFINIGRKKTRHKAGFSKGIASLPLVSETQTIGLWV